MKVNLEATKAKMLVINKRAWLRAKAKQHPDDDPLSAEILVMVLHGNYPLERQRAQQALRYMREEGFLVEEPNGDNQAA